MSTQVDTEADGPAITPFEARVSDAELLDLRLRLAATRWPEPESTSGWGQGVPLTWLQDLCRHWEHDYDWRRCEQRLAAFPQFTTCIDDVDIHFLHVRSPHAQARPLIMTHGWPGSVLEFLPVLEPLTDPTRFGGDAEDAFHVVCPSLPGYGFSGKPTVTGWGQEHIADAWVTLMQRLGYPEFIAQGGDWGSFITTTIARQRPERVIGIHVNLAIVPPDPAGEQERTPEEVDALSQMQRHLRTGTGYSAIQSTRPQTLGYGLVDSPAGLCGWIAEKFFQWSDNDGDLFQVIDRDQLLDNITLYWLTRSAPSAGRLYWESAQTISDRGVSRQAARVECPSAVSIFPRELMRPSRRRCERVFTDLRFYERAERGGHFAALEQPELFAEHLRSAARTF